MYLCSLKLVLEAVNASSLPISHGRLLHAAFLNIIREYNEELSEALHGEQIERFSLDTLRTKVKLENNTFRFKPGDKAVWKISFIGDDILKVLSQITKGKVIRISKGLFSVNAVICDNTVDSGTGLTTMAELKSSVFALPSMTLLQFDFLSPTTFRYQNFDLPFPRPEIIFGSLAQKWNAFSDEEQFDVKVIAKAAGLLVLESWHGESKRVNVTVDRGVTGFVGSFTYNLNRLPVEYRQLFILLAEFSRFTGVGRLTGQGLGRISIQYFQD